MWLITYTFAFQIFFDFAGYTDIARGSAMLFGYKVPINFNLPYLAENVSDFWRRWHISLSTWLRDYLFIPLGGSRKGEILNYRNLFITMALGGLWHGAAMHFLAWGCLSRRTAYRAQRVHQTLRAYGLGQHRQIEVVSRCIDCGYIPYRLHRLGNLQS